MTRSALVRSRTDRRGPPARWPMAARIDATTGVGHAAGHHGEILQGLFLDAAARPCRGLVTLPMPGAGTRAVFVRRPGVPADRLVVTPAGREKTLRAVATAVTECATRTGNRPCGGRLRLESTLPVGLGMGSSTSDIIAAVRAVAASFGIQLPPDTVARIAVHAEQAADPLMLGAGPVLFAPREGRVLEEFGPELPAIVVLSCTVGGGQPVDTTTLPPHRPSEVPAFERLRAAMRQAVATADLALIGAVSTESARRNQELLPKPELAGLERVAARVGAAGVQVAHSGNVAGLLFDPSGADLRDRLRHAARELADLSLTVGRAFRI